MLSDLNGIKYAFKVGDGSLIIKLVFYRTDVNGRNGRNGCNGKMNDVLYIK